jgi:hypothetical protein
MNTRNIWAFAFSLLMLTLAGCAAKSIQSDYLPKDDQNEGIVFFSVSHDLVGGRIAKAIFYLDGGITSGKGSMVFSLPDAFPGISAGSQFKDSYGQLIALALPAGKHQIDSWQIANGRGLRIFANKPSPLEFNVLAGKAKYLGNLHANLQTGKYLFGMTIVGNGYPEIRDRRARDVEAFEKKYPQFKGKVLIEMLALGPWIGEGGASTQVDIPAPVQPPPAGK